MEDYIFEAVLGFAVLGFAVYMIWFRKPRAEKQTEDVTKVLNEIFDEEE